MNTKREDGVAIVHAADASEWRRWLHACHAEEESVWLVLYHKKSSVESITHSQAIDEALCFGWIDSKRNSRDDQSCFQYFSRRKPKSNWSRVNKEKVERLVAEGRMMPAGQKMIDLAKENGTWTALDDVENLVVPSDLQGALNQNRKASDYWETFPRSAKRSILEWIFNAKRDETREKRIRETVDLASRNIRANSYRPQKSS